MPVVPSSCVPLAATRRRVTRRGPGGLLLAVAAIAFPAMAQAYGLMAHEAIGALAAELLRGTPTERRVAALLDGMSLQEAAIWADCAKTPSAPVDGPPRAKPSAAAPCASLLRSDAQRAEIEAFVLAHPNHARYHYADVPFQEPAYRAGTYGTDGSDVVQVLRECLLTLWRAGRDGPDPAVDGSKGPHRLAPRVALLLLAHLVGDLHQPLHVGVAYMGPDGQFGDPRRLPLDVLQPTEGDNLLVFSDGRSLHAAWDVEAPARAMRRAGTASPEGWAAHLLRRGIRVPDARSAPGADCREAEVLRRPQRWADESLALSARIHERLDVAGPTWVPPRLDGLQPRAAWQIRARPGQRDWTTAMAEQQVERAGRRLAAILQCVLP